MQFQKTSIPTPWKVNGNSEGVVGLKGLMLKGKYGAEVEIPEGWGLNQKTH